ncbi:MAG: hypothetical protein NXI31_25095 [bacterium]|nr:hypothetical protein [bacterium]
MADREPKGPGRALTPWLAGFLALTGAALVAFGGTLLLQCQMAVLAKTTGEPTPALLHFVREHIVTPLAHATGQSDPPPGRVALGARILAWLGIAVGGWLAIFSIRAFLRRDRTVESSSVASAEIER